MRLAVIGTGYVGLVAGTCFADSGNDVVCVDIDPDRIERLQRGEVPIYEPGLEEIIERCVAAGRLSFTTSYEEAVPPARCVFLAVGTPQGEDGSADLSGLWAAVETVAPLLADEGIVVIKSTVPVGTNRRVAGRLRELTGRPVPVVSNPEFMKEGAAIEDFTKPDRVVIGCDSAEVADVLRELYSPFLRTDRPLLVMDPESAEMTKYVANCLLATKISFINEVANLCERVGADVNHVRRGIGHDRRIGFAFLFPGVGYGGSCFPKDVRALMAVAERHNVEPHVLRAVDLVNEKQKRTLFKKIHAFFDGQLAGKTIAVWGLSFKPRTDDIREAPSLVLINALLDERVTVRVHDPVAMDNVRRKYGDRLTYCQTSYEALDGADALAIVTEWNEFRNPDFDEMKRRLRQPVIFDGRNLYDPAKMARLGFQYFGVGLPPSTRFE